jgi:Tfp pilus assembly protein PilN
MRAVNLLPGQDAGESKTPPVPILVACLGTVVVVAVLALMFLSASSKVGQERSALQRLQAQYAAIPAPPPPSPVVSQLPQQRQTRTAALATALGGRVAWDRLLREVSQVVPSDVWLVTLNAQSPTAVAPTRGAAPAAPANGFVVSGCTYSQESVARFLARLSLVPDLSAMTLGKSSSSTTSSGSDTSTCPKGMVTFSLQGNVRAAGAAS